MKQHDSMTLRFFNRIYDPGLRESAFQGHTKADFEQWAETARPRLKDLVGISAIEQSLPETYVPTVTFPEEPEDVEDYTRQKGHLLSEPDVDIPFWLLTPRGEGPFPLGIFPHGHKPYGMDEYVGLYDTEEERQHIEDEERDVAVQAVKKGFVAIAPATRGFEPTAIPDINSRHGGRDCRSQLMHALLAGRTAVGERVWDMMRFIDWAEGVAHIDTERILMMGNSGGGVVTTYTAACDPRVTVAVPSCSFCTFVGKSGCLYSCDCNIIPGIMHFGESADIAGLIAPRSLCIVNGEKDKLFPPSEVDKAVERVRSIFEAAGCSSYFIHQYGEGGHRFYKHLTWPFIERCLMNAVDRKQGTG